MSRLTQFNINWNLLGRVLEAKQEHDGRIKIAPRVRTVIAHRLKSGQYLFNNLKLN